MNLIISHFFIWRQVAENQVLLPPHLLQMIIMQSCPSVERACVQCSVQCVQCLGFYRLSVLRESAGTSDMTPVLRSRAGLFINIQYQSDLGRGNSKSKLWWRIHTLKASAQNIRVIQFLRLFKSYKSSELIIFEWSVKCQSQMYWTWEMWNIFCLICLKISLRSCHMSVFNIRCVLTCVSCDSWPSEGESWARLMSAGYEQMRAVDTSVEQVNTWDSGQVSVLQSLSWSIIERVRPQ